MKKQPLKILSLGAGVQSTAVLLMSCRGILPKLDAAIFADTQWEAPAVYEHLSWLENEAAKAGIPVHRVTAGSLRKHTLEGFVRGSKNEGRRYASMPMHVLSPEGVRGILRRQCTSEFKIGPVERFIRRELLGLAKGQKAPKDCVEQWFGISADELRRVHVSKAHWKTHAYPLVGLIVKDLNRSYTRAMCIDWLEEHYPGRHVPRSACIGCPYHSDDEWWQIKGDPDLWADVVEVDEAIRHAEGMNGQVFLHRSCRPLREVDLRTPEEKGQSVMPFARKCHGRNASAKRKRQPDRRHPPARNHRRRTYQRAS
ncbi:MAG: hypothetical protein FWD61_00220 [Phycisphaerales bacterium]|nr:hypothetical protein [Phycisphaerales bacterium]